MAENLPPLFLETDDEAIPPPPWWVKVGRALVALIAIAGVLYLSGIHQYLFLHRTSLGAQQPQLSSKVTSEQIVVPVLVHILTGDSGSARDTDDVAHLMDNANRIWAQGNITFVVQTISYHDTPVEDLRTFDREPHTFITSSATYDPAVVNLYLTRTLSGPPFRRAGVNGLAYGGTSAVAVADFTSNLDFRTLAHEFGHLLGLPHVPNTQRLMSPGATGVELTLEEIATARTQAHNYSL
jgi:hypothetical protein